MYLKKYHTDPFKTDKKFESNGIKIDIMYMRTTKTVKKYKTETRSTLYYTLNVLHY